MSRGCSIQPLENYVVKITNEWHLRGNLTVKKEKSTGVRALFLHRRQSQSIGRIENGRKKNIMNKIGFILFLFIFYFFVPFHMLLVEFYFNGPAWQSHHLDRCARVSPPINKHYIYRRLFVTFRIFFFFSFLFSPPYQSGLSITAAVTKTTAGV